MPSAVTYPYPDIAAEGARGVSFPVGGNPQPLTSTRSIFPRARRETMHSHTAPYMASTPAALFLVSLRSLLPDSRTIAGNCSMLGTSQAQKAADLADQARQRANVKRAWGHSDSGPHSWRRFGF